MTNNTKIKKCQHCVLSQKCKCYIAQKRTQTNEESINETFVKQNSSVSTLALIRTKSRMKSDICNVYCEQYDTDLFVILDTAIE